MKFHISQATLPVAHFTVAPLVLVNTVSSFQTWPHKLPSGYLRYRQDMENGPFIDDVDMYLSMYIYICVCISTYIYIYIHIMAFDPSPCCLVFSNDSFQTQTQTISSAGAPMRNGNSSYRWIRRTQIILVHVINYSGSCQYQSKIMPWQNYVIKTVISILNVKCRVLLYHII